MKYRNALQDRSVRKTHLQAIVVNPMLHHVKHGVLKARFFCRFCHVFQQEIQKDLLGIV